MWPLYLIHASYATALLSAIATVPIARRGARRPLWLGLGVLAVVLPLAATVGVTSVIPPGAWPVWRFALGYLLLLAVPIGVACLVADRLARRRPMPTAARHAALVACAVVATAVACVVATRPLTPDFTVMQAEK